MFKEICNYRQYREVPIALLLNKSDIFREKIQTVPIASIAEFHDYTGVADSFQEGVQYFIDKFTKIDTNRQVYPHVLCAVDADQTRVVLENCYQTATIARARR